MLLLASCLHAIMGVLLISYHRRPSYVLPGGRQLRARAIRTETGISVHEGGLYHSVAGDKHRRCEQQASDG